MADLDDIKDGKDFRTDQSQQNIPFILKGCGALDWGMQSRLSRIMQNQGVGKGNWRVGNALTACQNR